VINGETVIPNVDVPAGKDFIIRQGSGNATFVIDGKLTGAGTLEVATATSDIYIRGGNGNVTFSGAGASAADPDIVRIGSSGTATFTQAVSLSGDESEIYADVVFNSNVTTTAALKLFGDVTLVTRSGAVTGLTLSFTNPTDDFLTLGAGKTISARITPLVAGSTAVTAPLVSAGPNSPVRLEVDTAGAVLAIPAAPSRGDETSVNNAKKLTLSVQNLEITRGTLQVASGAVLEIDGVVLTPKFATALDPSPIAYQAVAAAVPWC
jgi:hypothetical protein